MLLDEIFDKVKLENARSKEKHGLWKDVDMVSQGGAIAAEFIEWRSAWIANDIHGEHGELVEAIQCINTLCRRIQFLTGEADA